MKPDVKELTIFDHLNNVFVTKNKNAVRDVDVFPFYMIQRWGSMHSIQMTLLLNKLCNDKYKALHDSKMEYDFLRIITPKLKKANWKYIKKNDKEKKVKVKEKYSSDDVSLVAKKLEMSSKDAKLLLDNDYETFKRLILDTEILKGKKILP
jgi:NACalpha-BTF3-like transcription factor